MRIAHFTNTYLPNINGVSRSVSIFKEALSRLGHTVYVFAPGGGGYIDQEPFIFRYPGFVVPGLNYSLSIPISLHINWVLPALKPDVIHSNHPVLLGDIAALKAEKLGLPLVFTFHTRYTEYSHYALLPKKYAQLMIKRRITRYVNKCQHIISPSNSMKELLSGSGLNKGVTVIPTGINLPPYQQAIGDEIRHQYGLEGKTVLVSVGRLAWEKNLETLLQAVAKVMQQDPGVVLLLVGGGPQRLELEVYTERLGIHSRVIFVGRVGFGEVPRYLKAGDIFTYASLTETQGLVTMEALAAGLPVVAVEATGTRDVVRDGEDGLLLGNDPQELAAGIMRLVKDLDLRHRMSDRAQDCAVEFDIMKQAEKMVAVYEQAIEDKREGKSIQVKEIQQM